MRRFPSDFSELLTARGQRLLAGADVRTGALCREGRRFLALEDVLDPRQAKGCLALLERNFPPLLETIDTPIPPESIWGMEEDYAELLPKAARVKTALFQSSRSRAYQRAQELGLIALLRSEGFRQMAAQLNGRPLRPRHGIQLLCYGHADYAGPHNDHHPEEPPARDGYLDLHLTLCNAQVAGQLLVYERRGHFSEVVSVGRPALLTAYRLPFWHYTTPLQARRGRETQARRWVLLGTFLDAAPPA